MKVRCFWFAILVGILLSSASFASDNLHMEACIRIVDNTIQSTTDDSIDTSSNCDFILNSYAVRCVETISSGFTNYPTTGESVYDGIDSNHILACALFYSHSSVMCLNDILGRRRPAVDDILACVEK